MGSLASKEDEEGAGKARHDVLEPERPPKAILRWWRELSDIRLYNHRLRCDASEDAAPKRR